MNEYLIFYILGLITFFYLGWRLREWWAVRNMHKILSTFEEELQETIAKSIINVNVEKIQDTFYLYNRDDNSFLAQGKDISTLMSVLEKQFPNTTFNLSREHFDMLKGAK